MLYLFINYQHSAMTTIAKNSKMRCYDMRLYLVEWVVLNHIYNMSKSQLMQACLYTEGKLSKQELLDLINYVRNFLKAAKARLKEQKEQDSCEGDE